jgi:chemotaxis methyl-accepting protein methylase
MNELRNNIIGLIKNSLAIDLSMYEQTFFEQLIQKRLIANNCLSYEAYFEILEKSKTELNLFVHSFQINYSEFFRNDLTFSVLNKIVLPEIILLNKENNFNGIRVWCAACSEGQEAYSIAILLEELSLIHKFEYMIFATDQSETCINTAQKGIYHSSQMGNLSMNRINKWFDKKNELFEVKSALKQHIEFSTFDLFTKQYSSPPGSIFGNFDIVFCANLLYYYKPDFKRLILNKTSDSLTKNGYLIISETEREALFEYKFKEKYYQSAIFQKK